MVYHVIRGLTEQRFQNRLFDIKKISRYRQLFTVSFAAVFLSNQVSQISQVFKQIYASHYSEWLMITPFLFELLILCHGGKYHV